MRASALWPEPVAGFPGGIDGGGEIGVGHGCPERAGGVQGRRNMIDPPLQCQRSSLPDRRRRCFR
jgi:hypothetical protein